MYGDCQVMSSMGGNVVVNSDTLFSSSIQNSNFNFIPTMPFQPFPSMVINCFFPLFFLHASVKSFSSFDFFHFCFWSRRKKMWCCEGRKRWRVGREVNRLKISQGMNKRVNNPQRRNAITGTLLARSKKWKRKNMFYDSRSLFLFLSFPYSSLSLLFSCYETEIEGFNLLFIACCMCNVTLAVCSRNVLTQMINRGWNWAMNWAWNRARSSSGSRTVEPRWRYAET